MSSTLYRWALHGALLTVSTVAAVLLAEGVSRLVLDRVDYLAVDPVFDPVLRVRLEPGAAGHDEWGFRNRAVPERADVVTIGDSQTYGISAPASLSWPAQLGKVAKQDVYNLALGGYGPVQYLELLRTRALRLRPSAIVVAFYFGNDLADAYNTVYGLRHWEGLRRAGFATVSDSVGLAPARRAFLGPVRDWLARHSVIYRLASFTALGAFARRLEFTSRSPDGDVVPFEHPSHGARTGFTPRTRLEALDLDEATVREGLRLSLDRLAGMSETCDSAGVRLLIALIPTKERVYGPWIERDPAMPQLETFRRLLHNEREANRRIRSRLDSLGVAYVDLELPLREAADRQAIYPANDDGHPNSEGYTAIARAVARALQKTEP